MRSVLVVILEDLTGSDRAIEGLRTAIGLALAGNRVAIFPAGGGAAPAPGPARELLEAFASLGGKILDETGAVASAGEAEVVIRWNP